MTNFLSNETMEHLFRTTGESLTYFAPELVLCGGIVLLLLLRMFPRLDRVHLGYVSLGVALLGLWFVWLQWTPFLSNASTSRDFFSGMLIFDPLTVFTRLFVFVSTVFLIWLSLLTGIPDREDSADFHTLLLGASLGMCLMGSANHLLMVFIAVEMASLPSYALAGFLKGRRQSSEAALKYVVYGGAAAGVMLYGISLLAGRFGTGYLPDVASSFLALLRQNPFDALLVIGLMMVLIGFAFKLSAVPFHFWCPDVFEGAAAEVAAYLSVASKGAAVVLLGRFTLTLAGAAGNQDWTPEELESWRQAALYLGPALAFFAAVTATFGNWSAYVQTNLKRLLAYSTIAHAGFMIMPLATLTQQGLQAALFYMVTYIFMNIGAFAVIAFLRNRLGSEDLRDYAGLIRRAPLQTICLALFLLSLIGIPPLIGFVAKYEVFAVLYRSYVEQKNGSLLFLLIVGLFNTVLSLFYYVKVLKVMIIDTAPDETPLKIPVLQQVYALLFAVFVSVMIFAWDPLSFNTQRATATFDRQASKTAPAAAGAVANR
jgi:NADH-quinone oxidoreductase subunit N